MIEDKSVSEHMFPKKLTCLLQNTCPHIVAVISSGVSLRHARHWRDGKLDAEPTPPIPSDADVEAMEILGVTPSDGAIKRSCLLKPPSRWEGESNSGRANSSSAFGVARTGEGVDEGDLTVTSIV
jgi:hypothetical protein